MMPENFDAFKSRMMAIGELYGKDITPVILDVYWETLSELTLEQFIHAINQHAKDPQHGRYMPKPADLIRVLPNALPSPEDRAQLAWSVIHGGIRRIGAYRSLEIDDRQAMAVIASMGGWKALCMTNTDKMEWKRKEFISIYQTFERTPLDQLPSNLPGIEELENHKRSSQSGLNRIMIGAEEFKNRSGKD